MDMDGSFRGKIKSIFCKNFLTFDECTFKPGPYLNVVTGPNGSGKSSIVSSVVLGLGGEPSILKRSHRIGEFVKTGCTEALIIVELFETRDTTKSFCRQFNLNDESTYKIDGVITSKQCFLAAVSNLHIQVNNLCQFLPQDRVQDFLKMNAQELLINTLLAIGNEEVISTFQNLMVSQRELTAKKEFIRTETRKEEEKQASLNSVGIHVHRFREREGLKARIEAYKCRLMWLHIDELAKKLASITGNTLNLKYEYNEKQDEYSTVQRSNQKSLDKFEKLREQSINLVNEKKALLKSRAELDLQRESIKKKVRHNKIALERGKSEYVRSKKLLQNETQHMEIKTLDYNNMPTGEDRTKTYEEQIMVLNAKAAKQNKNISDINQKLDDCMAEVNQIQFRLERVSNTLSQKMEQIKRQFPHVHRAICWLEQNRQIFRERIYNPMILELNVPNEENAKYLENTIKVKDLCAFTCENKEDMSIFISELCEKENLNISVIHSPKAETCKFKPSIPIERLRRLGFTSYLVDLVQGPAPIMNKLCSAYKIHVIPVGNESVGNFKNEVPNEIRLFFGGNKRYNIITSKYRSDTNLSEVQINRHNLLFAHGDNEAFLMQDRLNKMHARRDALRNQRTELESVLCELQYKRTDLINIKRKHDQSLQLKAELGLDISQRKQRIEAMRAALVHPNVQEERYTAAARLCCNDLLMCDVKALKLFEKLLKCSKEEELAVTKQQIFGSLIDGLRKEVKQIELKCSLAKKELEASENMQKLHQEQIDKKTEEALNLTNNTKPGDTSFPFERQFTELQNKSMEQLEEEFSELQAQYDCTESIAERVLSEHEAIEKEIEAIGEVIQARSLEILTLGREISEKYEKWIKLLDPLIASINSQFGKFMESMSFVGEIILSQKGEMEFDSYGIQIRVQYHKNIPIQPLDKCLQSGGERAVAIAVYTLSLQHLTFVPFRCVDEINQGMDPKNERKIFNMLLKETTKPKSSQYFFVTPKLLGNLEYNDKLSVLVIYNGKNLHLGNNL